MYCVSAHSLYKEYLNILFADFIFANKVVYYTKPFKQIQYYIANFEYLNF